MTTAISDSGVQFAGGNIVDVRSTMPSSGTYTAGDFVLESSTDMRVAGWKRLTTGSGHVLNTDWAYVGWGGRLATAQNTTSGTAIDFTGIPSWAKKITVMLNGVSTSGSSVVQIQIGSGSVTTSGYVGGSILFLAGANGIATNTSGFCVETSSGSLTSSTVRQGTITLALQTGSTWTASGVLAHTGTTSGGMTGGYLALAGTLDRLRLTTVGGTDTFDAGSVNILIEG